MNSETSAKTRWLQRLTVGVLLLLLAACAETSEHAEPASGSALAQSIGESSGFAELLPAAPLTAIPADTTRSAMNSRRDVLRQLLNAEIVRGDIVAPELRDDHLNMVWRGPALFTKDGAELQPQALAGLSRFAKWLRADGTVVLQIVGRQAGADAAQMSERRTAAVAAFLIAEGALAPRVRAQVVDLTQLHTARPSASNAFDNSITLAIVPVVAGREALAWAPPTVE